MGSDMKIQHNLPAIFAHRQLGITSSRLDKSLEKLSSGYRINHAADDAAGLAISEKLRTQVSGLEQASRNVQDGISLIQTAEGGMEELHLILQRIRVLAVQSANDTLTSADRALIQVEVDQLLSEINRMQTTVTFNTKQLLTGQFTAGVGSISLQAGANQYQILAINIGSMSTTGLGIDGISIGTQVDAENALTTLSTAIDSVSRDRANLGAVQNRLEHTYQFTRVAMENMQSSESRIRDVDMALEMTMYTKNQILQQAGNAMLAQANTRPSNLLALFQ